MAQDNILDQSVTLLLKTFETNPSMGLNQSEVTRRLQQYGYNEVPEKRVSLIKKFLEKFWGITAWMLELIIALSWFLHRFLDLYIVMSLLIINAIISFTQELLASNALESLRRQLHVHAKVLRDGKWSLLPARELVPGDIVSITTGDFVPADLKMISGSVQVNQSALTGESLPVEKNPNDTLYAGSTVRRGEAQCLVILTGARTYFGKTVELVQLAAPLSHTEEIISQITTWLLIIVTVPILFAFLLSVYKGLDLLEILPLMLVLLLGGIPVALPAMFTISKALGAKNLSKKNVLVTRLNAVEEAASMNVLCIDKTGTLTLNKLAIVEVLPVNGYTQDDVILYGALASQEASLDAIDLAFISAVKAKKLPLELFTIKKFIPFEPSTKRTEAVFEKDGHIYHSYKGALEIMAQDFALSQEKKNKLSFYEDAFAKRGFRTIAVAKTEDNGVHIIGLVALEDSPIPGAKQVITDLEDLQIKIKLLTGDALPIAQEIAKRVGLEESAVSFSQYKELKQQKNLEAAEELIMKYTVFAKIYPEDKYNIVKILQTAGRIVGMTGDGVNDAPALQQAEVGIAVSNATDVAKKAASIVLTQPGLEAIKELIVLGRLVFQRINTWIINKISRTVLKTGFIVSAFLLTGKFVISSAEMLLLIFMTDFIKLSLSTDNERISKKPCIWEIATLTRVGVILGVAMTIEALGLSI